MPGVPIQRGSRALPISTPVVDLSFICNTLFTNSKGDAVSDTVEIRVNVPLSRETEFYRWFADWRDGKPGETRPPESDTNRMPTDPVDEVSAATEWWRLLSPKQRALWGLWIDAAPRLLTADEIVQSLSLNGPRDIGPILAWVKRIGKKVEFTVTWEFLYDPFDGSPTYGLRDVRYAELLRDARKNAEEQA